MECSGTLMNLFWLSSIWDDPDTLHLKEKNLSIKSLRDVICVLDTIEHYWVYQAKQFFPNSSSLSAIYDSFDSKVLKLVKKDSFTLKVLKMYFVFFQGSYKTLQEHGRNVLYRTWKKTKYIFRTFRVKESFSAKQQSF